MKFNPVYFVLIIVVSVLWGACKNGKSDAQHKVFSNPALATVNAMIDESPNTAEPYYQRAVMLKEMGFDELALRDLQQAMVYAPNHPELLLSVGNLYRVLGHCDSSELILEGGKKQHPKNLFFYWALCETWITCSQIDKAQTLLEAMPTATNSFPEWHYYQAKIQLFRQDTIAGLSNLKVTVKTYPSYEPALWLLADVLSAQKNLEAMTYYEQIALIDSLSAQPLHDMAKLFYDLKDKEQAQTTIRRGLLVDQDFVDLYLLQAKIFEEEGSYPKALRQYDLAIAFEPTLAQAYWGKYAVYKLINQTDTAEFYEDQALVYDPEKEFAPK